MSAKRKRMHRAHQAVYLAAKAGRIKREQCERCGARSVRLHCHHWSYAQRNLLNVNIVCAPCHRRIHNPRREMLAPVALRLRRQGYTFAAIGKQIGCPISTAHKWVQFALKAQESLEQERVMV